MTVGEGRPALYLGVDLGTGGAKAALVASDGTVVASAFEPCGMTHPHPQWAEQDPQDWWRAVCEATQAALDEAAVDGDDVVGVAFAGQMLAVVPVDASGAPTRPAISWLDNRAAEEARRITRRMGGQRTVRAVAGATPSGKDVIAKVAWLRAHEPETYRRTRVVLDATGYLVARATGVLAIDHTGVSGTGMQSSTTRGWSRSLATLGGFPLSKMPAAHRSVDVIGALRADAAAEMGLPAKLPVVMGMGDAPAAEVGAGALRIGDVHVCLGTSAWIGVHLAKPRSLGRHGIVAIASGDPEAWLLVAETETAGASVEWFLRTIGVGAGTATIDAADGAARAARYEALNALVASSPPGARGVLFAPWLFGERAPVSDTSLRAAFVGLGLDHTRADLARAVLEGVVLNLRWSAEVLRDAGHRIEVVRAVGGGARSDAWCQALADALDVTVERVDRPQDAGAAGAALTVAVALGHVASMPALRDVVRVERTFRPEPAHRGVYDERYQVFRALHPALAEASRALVTSVGGAAH